MKFVSIADTFESNGTSLQGYIDADYFDLVEVFGEPTSDGDGYKVDAEWEVKFDDGTVAVIYNYKNGKNYCGSAGQATHAITQWNIGGFNTNAAKLVTETMKEWLWAKAIK